MYPDRLMGEFADFIARRDGIADKKALAEEVRREFCLEKDRSVFYRPEFAVRFCKADSRSFSNTVLSLSALLKYDAAPFAVCLVTPAKNYLMLANTTFLRKISHSSQELTMDNIKGSFNGSDIMREYEGFENEPGNFKRLFARHESFSPEENLERLVEATNNISPTGKRFEPTEPQCDCVVRSVERTVEFMASDAFRVLEDDLRERVRAVEPEIAIAASIDNVNLRGRIIEYLITSDRNDKLRNELIHALRGGGTLPKIFTADELGDYCRNFDGFNTAVDVKSKMLFLSSNPKGYNIDKLLTFLADDKSVYLIFIAAIDQDGKISTRLCSAYNRQILGGTRIIKHWAGRNSRGVTQYEGAALEEAVFDFDERIDVHAAEEFIRDCLDA